MGKFVWEAGTLGHIVPLAVPQPTIWVPSMGTCHLLCPDLLSLSLVSVDFSWGLRAWVLGMVFVAEV